MSIFEFLFILVIGPAVIFFLISIQRRSSARHKGWRYLTPGPMVWCAFGGGFLMTCLLCYIYFFVGNLRPDADFQMKILFWLIVYFNLSTVAMAYAIVADEVRWNDSYIERRTLLFKRRTMSWPQLAALGYEPWGYWWISAYDGPRIRFSPYSNGFAELIAKVRRELPPSLPPGALSVALEGITVRPTSR
jgi:hypothetical protein